MCRSGSLPGMTAPVPGIRLKVWCCRKNISFLEKQPGEILLIGFAEQNDKANHSTLLARLRADVVRRALIKAGVPRKNIHAHGYGPYLSLSSADSLASRIRNRRVEVWVSGR